MIFAGVVHLYIYHILYELGLFNFKNDCFIVVVKAILNDLKPTASPPGRKGISRQHLLTRYNNKQSSIISFQHRAAVCTRTLNGSLH